MAQRDPQQNRLEEFVQSYFQDLKQDLQEVRSRVEELDGKLTQRLGSVSQDAYLQELSRRFEAVAEREKFLFKLAEALQNFGAARQEEEALDVLVRYAEQMQARVLLLVRRGGSWVSFRDGKLNQDVAFRAGEDTVFERAARSGAMVADESAKFAAHEAVHRALGGEASYCVAVPLVFGESVPAVLYADSATGQNLNLQALEILCQAARLAIRALRAAEEVAVTQRQVVIPRPEPVAPTTEPTPPRTIPTPMMEKAPDYQIDFSRDIAAGHSDVDLAQQALQEDLESQAAFRNFQETATAPSMAETGPLPASALPPEAVAQKPKIESPAMAALTEEEERHHADARRFARLLVSELKLYNEQAVVEGRRNRDIYARLRQDIERSREMYNRRVPDSVTSRSDYFHEEVVKLLAEGDDASLGKDYPGSQTTVH